MKILLVRPPVPKHTIGLKHIMICEPLELEYVAASINGHELMIFDHLVEKGFKKRFKDFNPDVVVSSCYKTGTNEVIKIFRYVKTIAPKCITIVGGVHATLVPEDFADISVDIIGIGDGTMLLSEIINAIAQNQSLLDIPGVAIPIRKGELIKSPKRPYMPKADTLPLPRRDLVKHLKHKYYYLMHKPVVTMKTTWGCWYKCNFCFTWKITDGLPYSRSPESIVKELLTIEESEIYIVDDIFLINNSRLEKLAKLIKAHNIKKNYLCYARADFIVENEDVIKLWAELGLKAVFIGLDAITDEELKDMNKQSPAHYNKLAIEILRKYKVDTYGSLIPGADYVKKDWNKLWKFIKESKLYYVNISPATPLPGAADYKNLKPYLTVPEDAHDLFDLSHQLLPTKLTKKQYYRELLKLYGKTILNMKRANENTFRTLPSIWTINYWNIILGAIKIGLQFYNGHNHHSEKELMISRYKGIELKDYSFNSKFNHPSFQNFVTKEVSFTEDMANAVG
ncbi:B12-binding domain-containing radical SAM protein [Seonamhaeicola maritimus]|uniref:Radical SAM protein n=1 Tax=Seonamhaeicola maritimus TaxID=2591822 RepID=A0A5C7GK68_9FLAO|nr:radical SAM protein [Seonamhaeicola maritimus]TXG38672.1 radical SAM protein [Seonamhaeicola maritimus]